MFGQYLFLEFFFFTLLNIFNILIFLFWLIWWSARKRNSFNRGAGVFNSFRFFYFNNSFRFFYFNNSFRFFRFKSSFRFFCSKVRFFSRSVFGVFRCFIGFWSKFKLMFFWCCWFFVVDILTVLYFRCFGSFNSVCFKLKGGVLWVSWSRFRLIFTGKFLGFKSFLSLGWLKGLVGVGSINFSYKSEDNLMVSKALAYNVNGWRWMKRTWLCKWSWYDTICQRFLLG